MNIPKRIPLALQVAESLEQGIRSGKWRDRLPPERELASILQVSRPTVRSALATLERQGKIKKGGRMGRKIVALLAREQNAPGHRSIGVLIFYRSEEQTLSPNMAMTLLRIQQGLHQAGYEMEIHFRHAGGEGRTLPKIIKTVDENPSACWLLIGAAPPVQTWFHDRKLPAAVIGSASGSHGIPAFDIDYRAVCRHAGQLLWRRGHRRIALVAPESNLIGDTMSEQGFLEGLAPMEDADKRIQVFRHDATVESVRRILDRAMTQAHPPTALLITRTRTVLTALGHLPASGYRIPGDITVLSRDHDEFLTHVVPFPAHYAVDLQAFGDRICKCLLALAASRGITIKGKMIFSSLVEGQTLAHPPVGK